MWLTADYVQCGYCGEIIYVVMGSEVCPKCKHRGGLAWADPDNPDNQEVEVHRNEVANIDDYWDVVNETEKAVND